MNAPPSDAFAEYMAQALPKLMARISREHQTALTTGKISLPQFYALHFLYEKEEMTVNELAEAINRKKSSTSGLVSRLVDAGLILRRPGTRDRRVVYLRLSAKGKRLAAELNTLHQQGIDSTYASLTDEEKTTQMIIMNKLLNASLLLLLSGILLSPSLSHAKSYTLKESIQIGLNQSVAVANAARQREIAKAKQRFARSEAFPQLNATADYTLANDLNMTESGTKAAGAEASWQIFAGGRVLSAIRAAKAYNALTSEQEQRIRARQVLDISTAYYTALLAQAEVEVLKQSVKQLTDFEEETRLKYEAGTASEFDWLSARVALSNEKPRLIAAENRYTLAIESFRNLTYIEDDQIELSDTLSYTPINIGLDEAIALGMVHRPELQEKHLAIDLRREDINQQKSSYYPSVDLFANYSYSDPDPFSFLNPGSDPNAPGDHWTAGVRASWKLFDGGARNAQVAESKLNMAIEEDELTDLKRTIALEIRTQWILGRDSEMVIQATKESVELAQRALDIARTRFEAGLSTNLEVTQANLELSDAKLARYIALREYMNAVTSLKYAIGILLKEFNHEDS